jgi:hypothetical protein
MKPSLDPKHNTKVTNFFANPQETRNTLFAAENDGDVSAGCGTRCTSCTLLSTGPSSLANTISNFMISSDPGE